MIYFEVDNENKITLQHFQPFNEKDGMGKTEDELRKTGYLVESLPNPEIAEGKMAVLKFNADTKELYYEYQDRPLSTEENVSIIQKENELLKAQNSALSEKTDFIEELIAEMAMQIYQ